MSEQIYFEDVEVGTEIPTLVKHPTTTQLVKWAGASGDYYPIHYDKDFAQSMGLPGVIVHGFLSLSFLQQMIFNYFGVEATVKKLGGNFRGVAFPGEDMFCKAKVVEKFSDGGEDLVKCEMWVENQKGDRITVGSAMVSLPSRG